MYAPNLLTAKIDTSGQIGPLLSEWFVPQKQNGIPAAVVGLARDLSNC
jgi:hypothetical protein